MKQILSIFILAGMLFSSELSAQTATNFTAMDCNSENHTLFDELDAGKVIVLSWVMPCFACTAPALAAYSEVQNYASTHAGRVKYYLVDDYANTSCKSLRDWGVANGITNPDAVFSNNAINMNNFGGPGMPKIVVIGQQSHTIYYNQNNTFNLTEFKEGINNALGTSASILTNNSKYNISISPNPVLNDLAIIDLDQLNADNVIVDIFDVFGKKVLTFSSEKSTASNQQIEINTSTLSNGVYLATVKSDKFLSTLKFSITK